MIVDKTIKYTPGIYLIRNTVTKETYVGSSSNVHQRLMSHRCKSAWEYQPNNLLYVDMQKYGLDKFECKLLEYCNRDCLFEREQFYIDRLHPHYNRQSAKRLERIVPCSLIQAIEEYRQKHESPLEKYHRFHDKYYNRMCLYNGKEMTLKQLENKFRHKKYPHPTLEAKKYLIS